MLFVQDQEAKTSATYFTTDMFAVQNDAFTDRGDARFVQTAQAPRLTGSDVTKIGQYLAAQIQASSKDVSYLCLSYTVFFLIWYDNACREETPNRHMLASCNN